MQLEPPIDLATQILGTIKRLERRFIRRRLVLLYSLSAASLVSLIPSLANLGQALNQSGFTDYLALLSSDGLTLANYWREFTWSLIDSLPLTSLIVSLGILAVCLWSTATAVKNSRLLWI